MFFYALFAFGIAVGRPLVATSCIIGSLHTPARNSSSSSSCKSFRLRFQALLPDRVRQGIGYVHSKRNFRSLGILLPLGFVVIFMIGDDVILRGLAATAILVGALSLERSTPKLNLLKALGDASYAIYLFHVPALLIAAEVVKRLPLPQGWLQFGLMIATCMVASMFAG